MLYFTGLLCILAALGYIFYGLLWVIRKMQISRYNSLVFTVLFLLTIFFLGFYLFLPLPTKRTAVQFTVKKNASLYSIADSLKSKGCITSKRALVYWVKLLNIDRKIQAGQVQAFVGEGVILTAKRLLKAIPNERRITIPEGLTIEQIASRIAKFCSIDTLEFVALCNDSKFIKKFELDVNSLEGYLYPNTYFLKEDETSKQIITRMVEQFKQAIVNCQKEYTLPGNYSLHQIVTLASIVEKESVLDSERARIAAVFWNRLALDYPLGADPTVRYIFKKFDGPLLVSELNTDSPYNTRKFKGLPPGPICSPGIKSIVAVLAPMKTKELYFVAKWDGSGAHDFSFSNEEHVRKKNKIRTENENRKRLKTPM